MTRLTIALALILALTLPPAAKPSCYLIGNARNMACRRGRVSVPLWVCTEVNR